MSLRVFVLSLLALLLLGCPSRPDPSDDDDVTTDDDDSAPADDDDSAADDDDATEPGPCDDAAPDESFLPDPTCTIPIELPNDPTIAVQWQWDTFDEVGWRTDVMMTPVVTPVTDTNSDGLVNESDDRVIFFSTFGYGFYGQDGTLRAIPGSGPGTTAGGAPWTMTDASYDTMPDAGLAAANLDADPEIEVVAVREDGRLFAVDGNTGAIEWTSETTLYPSPYKGMPFITDLEGDGSPEILYGRQIFDAQGVLLAEGDGGVGGNACTSFFAGSYAVDLDGDGVQEVIAGNRAYGPTGNTLWTYGSADQFTGVGNFDSDPEPEIVGVSCGQVRIYERDGTLLYGPVAVGSGSGGPPTVADFDGDGLDEVGVAGLSQYRLYDSDLTVLWSNPTADQSSSVTGSSAFDFNNDGASEIVYADELDLWIWDGTGALIHHSEEHASGTHVEYPVVANVMGDGVPEIVLGSNALYSSGWQGVTVLGDPGRQWPATRGVWNQHAFMTTHITADLQPTAPNAMPWTMGQGFRQNEVSSVPGQSAPDLTAEVHAVCGDGCPGSVRLRIRVHNAGFGLSDVAVSVRRAADGVEVGSGTVSDLGPGARSAAFDVVVPADASGDLELVVDPLDVVVECDESNNVTAIPAADLDVCP